MSKSTATRARPLSPHIMIYRLTPTMLMSGMHRATGCVLYFGIILFAVWIAAASGTKEQFDFVNMVFGSIIGRLILLGFTWSLIHHLLGGLRHFVWDLGHGLEKDTARRMSIATLVGSVTLTIIVWAVGLAARGAF